MSLRSWDLVFMLTRMRKAHFPKDYNSKKKRERERETSAHCVSLTVLADTGVNDISAHQPVRHKMDMFSCFTF